MEYFAEWPRADLLSASALLIGVIAALATILTLAHAGQRLVLMLAVLIGGAAIFYVIDQSAARERSKKLAEEAARRQDALKAQQAASAHQGNASSPSSLEVQELRARLTRSEESRRSAEARAADAARLASQRLAELARSQAELSELREQPARQSPPNPVPARGASKAEHLVPRDFDPRREYGTFTTSELREFVSATAGQANAFVGKRAKVFGYYVTPEQPMKDRIAAFGWTRVWGFKEASGKSNLAELCAGAFCQLLDEFNGPGYAPAPQSRPTTVEPQRDLHIGFQFRVEADQKRFVAQTTQHCTRSRPCGLWVSGTLRFTQIDAKRPEAVGTRKEPLAYLELDAVSVYQGNPSNRPTGDEYRILQEFYVAPRAITGSTEAPSR